MSQDGLLGRHLRSLILHRPWDAEESDDEHDHLKSSCDWVTRNFKHAFGSHEEACTSYTCPTSHTMQRHSQSGHLIPSGGAGEPQVGPSHHPQPHSQAPPASTGTVEKALEPSTPAPAQPLRTFHSATVVLSLLARLISLSRILLAASSTCASSATPVSRGI